MVINFVRRPAIERRVGTMLVIPIGNCEKFPLELFSAEWDEQETSAKG